MDEDVLGKKLDVTVVNKLGLHARPAAQLVRLAMGFESEITLSKDGETANAKSIMGIMSFAACMGTVITIDANGSDADTAVEALANLFADKFGEE